MLKHFDYIKCHSSLKRIAMVNTVDGRKEMGRLIHTAIDKEQQHTEHEKESNRRTGERSTRFTNLSCKQCSAKTFYMFLVPISYLYKMNWKFINIKLQQRCTWLVYTYCDISGWLCRNSIPRGTGSSSNSMSEHKSGHQDTVSRSFSLHLHIS